MELKLKYAKRETCPLCHDEEDLYWAYYKGEKTSICEACIEGSLERPFLVKEIPGSKDLVLILL